MISWEWQRCGIHCNHVGDIAIRLMLAENTIEEIYFYSVTVTIQGLDRVNIFWGV
jgi:hypothetical protein